jgi:hypothetical protein
MRVFESGEGLVEANFSTLVSLIVTDVRGTVLAPVLFSSREDVFAASELNSTYHRNMTGAASLWGENRCGSSLA